MRAPSGIALPEAALPATVEAEPVVTKTYDNAAGKVMSNCNALIGVAPAANVMGRSTVDPALPVADPIDMAGTSASASVERRLGNKTIIRMAQRRFDLVF